MAANLDYVDLIDEQKAADLLSFHNVVSFELGDGVGRPQTEIALHLDSGQTLFIGAQLNADNPLTSLWFGVPKS